MATLVALITTFVAIGIGVAVPAANAKPDLATVKKQVEELDRQAEIASERYNEAKAKLAETRATLAALKSDLLRQQGLVDQIRTQVAAMVVEQYQGNALSTTSQVVLSDNPDAFLNNLNAVTAYNDQRGQTLDDFGTQLSRLQLRKRAVQDEAGRLKVFTGQMATAKAQIEEKAAKAQKILDSLKLKPAARVALLGGGYTGPIPTVAASGHASAALHYALAQVGKAYVYGASGPNAFDCSGLTMAAWGTAGVALPHSAAAQYGMGTPIPESQLQPGDLVFYYSPISHVGMYIGNGLIVNALNPSTGVAITSLHSMPYVGAVRPG